MEKKFYTLSEMNNIINDIDFNQLLIDNLGVTQDFNNSIFILNNGQLIDGYNNEYTTYDEYINRDSIKHFSIIDVLLFNDLSYVGIDGNKCSIMSHFILPLLCNKLNIIKLRENNINGEIYITLIPYNDITEEQESILSEYVQHINENALNGNLVYIDIGELGHINVSSDSLLNFNNFINIIKENIKKDIEYPTDKEIDELNKAGIWY